MLRKSFGWAAFLLPAVLGGCLLPQPDTPPVGPIGPGSLISARTGAAAPKPGAESVPKNAGEVAGSLAKSPSAAGSAAPLLPQPDTPPIANNAGALISENATNQAAGGTGALPEIGADAGMPPQPRAAEPISMVAPDAGMTQPTFATPAQPPMATTKVRVVTGDMTVTVRANGVTEVVAVSADGLRYARGGDTADDVFAFTLPAGEFWLEFRLNGKILRVDGPLTVDPGGARSFILRVTGEPPRASVEEAVALVAPGSP